MRPSTVRTGMSPTRCWTRPSHCASTIGSRTRATSWRSSTPTQDATAAVDAALRGIVEIGANEHILALQALRIYSKRWDPPGGLE